jgi:HPt (histidine-containing phosphotransfer) domain-containing protein
MDIQMPEMDGYSATMAIRKDPRWTELPIVAMTANAMTHDRERAMEVGMNDHLPKPVDVPRLHQVLRRWLKPASIPLAKPAIQNTDREPSGLAPPSFDAAEGLKNSGGNARLYRQLLERFHKQGAELMAGLRRHMADGDREAAIRAVHTLKSTAATVGAKSIKPAAARLERKWRGGGFDDWETDLAQLDAIIQPVLADFEVVRPTSPSAPPPTPDHSPLDLSRLLSKLRDLILEDDIEAVGLSQDLAKALADHPDRQFGQALATALAGYEFDTARVIFGRLEASLGEPLSEKERR